MSKQQQSQSGYPGLEGFIWVALTLVLLAVTWYYGHTYFSIVALWCAKTVEPIVLLYARGAALTGSGLFVKAVVPLSVYDWTQLEATQLRLHSLRPEDVTFGQFRQLVGMVGVTVRPLIPVMAFYFISRMFKATRGARYERKMSARKLALIAQNNFPAIRPAFRQDLLAIDPDEGPFAREKSPIRLAIEEELLFARSKDIYGRPKRGYFIPTFNADKNGLSVAVPGRGDVPYRVIEDQLEKSISKLHGSCEYRRDRAAELFLRQLGSKWDGYESLCSIERILFSCLLQFGLMDKDGALERLDDVARIWEPDKEAQDQIDALAQEADTLWEDIQHEEDVIDVLTRHAYTSTMFAGALRYARAKGKLPTARFLWLKPENRTLWYTLNQEGGQCTWSEAAGPRSHLLAELAAGGAVYQPFTESAEKAMESYLDEGEGWIYRPPEEDPDQDNIQIDDVFELT